MILFSDHIWKKKPEYNTVLNHPNIVQLLGLVCEPNNYGIVLEYMENGDMKDYLETNPLSWQEKLHLVKGVVLAMSYLHSQNIIHGDLKMQNVLIDESRNAKVGVMMCVVNGVIFSYWVIHGVSVTEPITDITITDIISTFAIYELCIY